jgi:hypothetical protein
MRLRRYWVGLRWTADVVGCTALHPSDRRLLRIYFGAGSSIDFARARRGDCARYHKIVPGNLPDRDRRTAHGHGTGNHL